VGATAEDVTFAPDFEIDLAGVEPLRPGLYVFDLSEGVGEVARRGDDIRVEYMGWLADGQLFDSSVARGEPIEFRLGANRVIDGWDLGIEGMRVGGVRRLVLAPRWGYGMEGSERVPANAHLVFEIQLLRIGSGVSGPRTSGPSDP
jgi:FKBP-type peptidyl-prolyl cis-trans isomerase